MSNTSAFPAAFPEVTKSAPTVTPSRPTRGLTVAPMITITTSRCVRHHCTCGGSWPGLRRRKQPVPFATRQILLAKPQARFWWKTNSSSIASLPCTGPDLLIIDQSNRCICLASQCTQRMETHFCLALANQEAHFCLALLSIAPHFA